MALSCGHFLCKECLHGLCRAKINENKLDELVCPECPAPLQNNEVMEGTLGYNDFDLWQKFDTFRNQDYIEGQIREGAFRRCPNDKCSYTFEWQAGDRKHFVCDQLGGCGRGFCLACEAVGGAVGPEHPDMTCAMRITQLEEEEDARIKLEQWRAENSAADERFQELMQREQNSGTTKPCPNCGEGITHIDGCDHHICTVCKMHLCWNCGRFQQNSYTCSYSCGSSRRKWW